MSSPIGINVEAGTPGIAARMIRRELGKACLDQAQHIDEVLQESLVKILQRQAGGKPIRNIDAYFVTVCQNTARKYMKTVIHRQQREEPWSEALEGQICLPDEPLVDERSLVLAALAKISPRSQEILKRMYIDELDPKEIQSALGCTYGALRTAKHRALKALREALKELTQ